MFKKKYPNLNTVFMHYYLFRHGETYYTKNKLPYGDAKETAEILPEAVFIIKKLAEFIKNENIKFNYSSPYLRCRQTVGIIEKITKTKFEFDKRIGEERTDIGESVFDMEKRIDDFLKEKMSDNDEKIAICSHGWPIAVMHALIAKNNFTQSDLLYYPKPGEIWIIEGKELIEIKFN